MAKYRVGQQSIDVDFAPEGVMEILQNVRTILATRKGSVPLDRDFGISWNNVDQSLPAAKMLMRSEVIDAIERYEPRAKVTSVDFAEDVEGAMDGVLKPIVTVQIGGE